MLVFATDYNGKIQTLKYRINEDFSSIKIIAKYIGS